MKNKLSLFRLLLVTLAASFSLTACGTFKGAGKDLEKAGEKIQDAAK